MTSLKINLFGEFRVWRGEELVESKEWDRQKTRSLLKLLLTRPGHIFSRDEIFEALWPGVSPKAAERSLRVTVSLLRRALEPNLGRGTDSRYVLQQKTGIHIRLPNADCWVDAWEFEGALQQKADNGPAGRRLRRGHGHEYQGSTQPGAGRVSGGGALRGVGDGGAPGVRRTANSPCSLVCPNAWR